MTTEPEPARGERAQIVRAAGSAHLDETARLQSGAGRDEQRIRMHWWAVATIMRALRASRR